jgi:hypothetical protein
MSRITVINNSMMMQMCMRMSMCMFCCAKIPTGFPI